MKDKETPVQDYNDEIDLRELIMALWKQKIMIISFTLITTIIAGIFSVFILSPVFNTKSGLIISMPEVYSTQYGEYTLPISTNKQYIDLITSNNVLINTINDMKYDKDISVESLRSRITVSESDNKAGVDQNSFAITVSANNPEESLELTNNLYKNYIEFMDVMLKERTLSHFYNNFLEESKTQSMELEKEQELLAKNEKLLLSIDKTINQKDALDELDNRHVKDYIILENIINPNYTLVEGDIIANKQRIFELEESINITSVYIENIIKEREIINKYYDTGIYAELDSSLTSVVETGIYRPSLPVKPSVKSSPKNVVNIAIGAVLGGMLGVMVALVKQYWFSEED